MTIGELFAGIGGFGLGLEAAGMEVKWQVEINEFRRAVLAKHWPNVQRFADIRDCGKHNLAPVDLICGGFPCQPFSVAGKRRGTADDRYLWPEMLRVIAELRPRWVLAENVVGILHLALDTVLTDLEGEGYEVQTFDIPACALDAAHRRARFWIVAYRGDAGPPRAGLGAQPEGKKFRACDYCSPLAHSPLRQNDERGGRNVAEAKGRGQSGDSPAGSGREDVAYADAKSKQGLSERTAEKYACFGVNGYHSCLEAWPPDPAEGPVESHVGRVADGVPRRVERLAALGDAIVPQIAEAFGRMILKIDKEAP